MSNRAKRKARRKQLEAELHAQQEQQTKQTGLSHVADEDLFVVDTGASGQQRRDALDVVTGTVQLYQPPAEYEDKSVVDAKLRERAAKGQLTRGKKRRRSVTAVPSGAGGGGIAAPERIQHGVYDLWGSAPEAAASASHAEDILPLAPNAAERQQRMQQEGRAGLPTDVPAVPLIAPGASYNPSFEDHQDLLGEETARQMALEATEVRVANAMEPRGSDGLVSDGSSDGEEEDDDDFLVSHPSGGEEPAAAGGATTVVTASKLTRAQLNKRARHAALRAQQAADAADRKLLRSLDHLETLQGLDKHAQRVERKNAARRKQRRAELLAARRSNPVRRKGSAPVPDSDLPIQVALSEHITGGLRTMRATTAATAAAKERFANLHRRQLLQVEPEPKKRRRMFKILRNK